MIFRSLSFALLITFRLSDYKGFLGDAIKTLNNCPYLQKTYPLNYTSLHQSITSDNVTVILSPNVLSNAIAQSNHRNRSITISNQAWDDSNPVFRFGLNYKRIMAHEILHLIDLPNHEEYTSYEDYKLNDPIEVTLKMCFING